MRTIRRGAFQVRICRTLRTIRVYSVRKTTARTSGACRNSYVHVEEIMELSLIHI